MPPTGSSASGATPGPEGAPLLGKKLVSWKEIAAHLQREVRTVQRWEKTEGLPVHRHEHQKKSTVYAYSGELDAWFLRRQPKDDPAADAAFEPELDPGELLANAIAEPVASTPSPVPVVSPPPAPVVADARGHTAAEEAPGPALPNGKRRAYLIAFVAVCVVLAFAAYRLLQPRSSSGDRVRIAVLPFNYVSGDAKPDYITSGLTDVIRTKLGQLDPAHLGVIAATSSKIVAGQPIPDIGRALNVKYVLEGSVQRAGNQVRIDVQLIQVSDETHLWAESFTRELSDVLQVESDVSAAIARQVLATLPVPPAPQPLSSSRSTVHAMSAEVARSRHAYHQAKFAWGSRGDLPSSISFFEEAIREDSSYAEAYAGLAGATAIIGQVPNDGMPPREAQPKAREAAQKALQLNPRLAEAHAVLGNVAMNYDWDLATAEKELRRAIELNPSDPSAHEWYGHLLIVEGRHSEALGEAHRSLDLDPVNPLFHTVLIETYYYNRDFDSAIQEGQQVVKLHPDFLLAQFWLGSAYREKKMYAEAVETFRRGRQLSGDQPAMLMAYGHAQALAGDVNEARSALDKLEQLRATRFVPNLYSAAIHVGLGESDEAFRFLDLAYQEKVDRLVYLNAEPMADPIRSDPRFAQLVKKIGLP